MRTVAFKSAVSVTALTDVTGYLGKHVRKAHSFNVYRSSVFMHTRRGNQILLQMVVRHHVAVGN